MSRGSTLSGDSFRHDHQAIVKGFAGGMGILLSFAIGLCIFFYILYRRYESDEILRQRFVKRNIPSKTFRAENEPTSSEDESKLGEVQEAAPPVHDPEDGDMCSICLVTYKNRDRISWSTNEHCTHTFHKNCIVKWLYKHSECPMCREAFLWEKEQDHVTEEGNIVIERDQDNRNDTIDAVASPSPSSVTGKEEDEEIYVA